MQVNELSQSISHELNFLLYSFLLGIVITYFYDNIRIIRRIIHHNVFFVSLEDLIFWVVVSLSIFILQYYENNGVFRWFSIIGSLLGMVLYKVTLSEFYVKYMAKLLKILLTCLFRICSFLLRPLFFAEYQAKRGIGFFCRKVYRMSAHQKNRLTMHAKLIKITLCKHHQRKDNAHEQKNSDS